jgi:hypothetical protein
LQSSALPRVEIEVNPPQRLSGAVAERRTGNDVVDAHVGMPHRRSLHRTIGEVEELAAGVEHAAHHVVGLEVRPGGLRIEPELLDLHPVRVVPVVPDLEPLRPWHVLAFPGQELGQLALRARIGGGRDPIDERRGGAPGLDHLGLGGVVRPVGVAEECGQLVALGQQSREHLDVRRRGAGAVGAQEALPGCLAPGVGHEGVVVRVIGGEDHLPLGVGRVRLPEVRGEAGQLGGSEGHLLPAVADVPVELLPDGHQRVAQRPNLCAGGVVPVHAGAPELAQVALHPPDGGRVLRGEIEPGERVVQRAVLIDGGVQ